MLFAGYLVYQNYDQLRNSCGGGGSSGNILTEYDDPITASIRWSSEDGNINHDNDHHNKSDSDLVTDAGVRSSTSTTTTKSRQKGTVRKKQRRGTQKESNNNKSNVSSKRRGKEQEANRIRGKAEERKEETNSSRSRTSTEDTPQHRIFDLLDDDDDGADSARTIINGNPTKTKNGRNRCRSNTRSNSISSRSETQRRTSSKGSSSKKPYRHSRPPLYICTDTADDQDATPTAIPAWTPAAESGSGSSASSGSGPSFRRNNNKSSPTHTTAVAVNIDKYWSDRSAV